MKHQITSLFISLIACSVLAAGPTPNRVPKYPVAAPKTAAPAVVVTSAPKPAVTAAQAPAFKPLTKAELIRSLERNRDDAQLMHDIMVLGGTSPDSGPAREQLGRMEAFQDAIDLAELLP